MGIRAPNWLNLSGDLRNSTTSASSSFSSSAPATSSLKWKKKSSADGYQLYYKAKGTKAKKVTINNVKTVKKTVKKLKAGKKYSFKIRTFNKVEDLKTGKLIKVYGKWSGVKKAKAKK